MVETTCDISTHVLHVQWLTAGSWMTVWSQTSAFLIIPSWGRRRMPEDEDMPAVTAWDSMSSSVCEGTPCALPYRAWQELVIGSVAGWLRWSFLLVFKPLSFLPRRYPYNLPSFASLTSIFGFLFDIINGLFGFWPGLLKFIHYALSHPRQPNRDAQTLGCLK